jgi:hypothetical protein
MVSHLASPSGICDHDILFWEFKPWDTRRICLIGTELLWRQTAASRIFLFDPEPYSQGWMWQDVRNCFTWGVLQGFIYNYSNVNWIRYQVAPRYSWVYSSMWHRYMYYCVVTPRSCIVSIESWMYESTWSRCYLTESWESFSGLKYLYS